MLSQQLEDERKTYRKTREEMEQMKGEMEQQEDQIEKLKSEVVSRNSEILAGKHQINMLSMLLSQKWIVSFDTQSLESLAFDEQLQSSNHFS